MEILQAQVTKLKVEVETTSTAVGDGPRESGRGGQARKGQHIVHPYRTDLEEFLNKPSKDAGNPSLGEICDYCGITRDQLLTDLDIQYCSQFLVMGTCMFENHASSTIT